MDDEGNLVENELEYRLVMMSVWMRCDHLDQKLNKNLHRLATILVDQVLDTLIE